MAEGYTPPGGPVSETRMRWMVALGAAVVLAVCVTLVVLALMMHPAVTVGPGL